MSPNRTIPLSIVSTAKCIALFIKLSKKGFHLKKTQNNIKKKPTQNTNQVNKQTNKTKIK